MKGVELQSPILDAQGHPITRGAIVGMSEPYGNWSRFQGVVVEPNSNIEDDGYCVAVFFNLEVGAGHFNNFSDRKKPTVSQWDKTYGGIARKGYISFLFEDDAWKNCPRIIFFRPTELKVEEEWNLTSLADRFFKDSYHTIFSLKKELLRPITEYMCWHEDCRKPATKIALCNTWGSINQYYVCNDCYPQIHGMCSDMVRTKRPLLLRDGTAAPARL